MPNLIAAARDVLFNPVFRDANAARCRYVLLMGGAGSGKSCNAALRCVLRVAAEPGRNLLVVRKIADSHRYSTYAELCAAIDRAGLAPLFTLRPSVPEIECANGNRILFAGCLDDAQRAKLKSIAVPRGKITDIWIEEATDLTPDDFQMLDDRLRGRLDDGLFYQILCTFNPVSSAHWLKRQFFDRPDPNVCTCRSTYRDNLFCDEEYRERMERRRIFDPEGYRVYGLGEWGEAGGLILPRFCVAEFDAAPAAFDGLSAGQDFGFNNPNALLSLGLRDGDIYVRRELYLAGCDTADLIAEARGRGFETEIAIYCDCAEPDRILSWCRAGFRAVGARKYPGSVRAEIDWLKQRKIIIHPSCENTIREIGNWKWQAAVGGGWSDSPVCHDDHAMAALRYGSQPWRDGGGRRAVGAQRRTGAFWLPSSRAKRAN